MAENEWAKPKPENAWVGQPTQLAETLAESEASEAEDQVPEMSAREAAEAARDAARDRVRGGANLFILAAGISFANTLIVMFGGQWRLIFGLAICDLLNAFFRRHTMDAGSVYVANLIITAVFVFVGLKSKLGLRVWFATGMFLYVLDGALSMYLHWYKLAGVHLIALYYIWKSFRQIRGMQEAEETLSQISRGLPGTMTPTAILDGRQLS